MKNEVDKKISAIQAVTDRIAKEATRSPVKKVKNTDNEENGSVHSP